ncbi:MAG: 4-vinyl reductase [Chloroflexi bacterium]|nr:4-vinyl reductase [Chloroflexota bacterium]MBZ0316517.1 4-vinyl reductase [Anaerolineae bacterium]MCQ3933005.1 4-vinyl reductase [Chloroflexota bacterium]NOG63474.1 4-vinyl reductase [Chloroflexota bacterium]GIK62333.1 MAG: 4-vinyl reductase [Chloroflexota bacterium]
MPPEKSGFNYPNKFALIILMAMEEIMGKNGLNAILHLAGLEEFIGSYPPDNLEKQFDFAHITALNVALEEMYGPRGGRGLALRAGRATFAEGLKGFGALAGVGDLAFKVLPLPAKLKIGLPAMANILTQFSDQISNVTEENDKFVYTLERCPMCWKRTADRPVCYLGQGLLQEGLRWVSGGHEFKVDMATCIAKGDDIGRYVIFKEPIG